MAIDQDSMLDLDQDQDQDQQQDYGEWNERLPENLQSALKRLVEHFRDEFKYPRRLEVMQAWRSRCFWRELQHLSWNWENECWDVLGPAGAGGSLGGPNRQDSAVLYSTNMYQGFGEAFIAIITQAVPNVRFEPEDATEAADIEAARVADDFRKYIQHENDPVRLMTKAAYLAYTDGRMHGRTWWGEDKRTNEFREMQCILGIMEVAVPIIYDEQCSYPYVRYSDEYHVSTVRADVRKRDFDPDYWKKIKGGSSGNGQDVYERTARISVKQGISMKSAGGNAYEHLTTVERTWMRPSAFMEDCIEDADRDTLESLFPTGCYVEHANGVYIGSKDASMDDEWTIKNIMEGDGSYRNAKGTCLLSVQERGNDIINATQDIYEKTLPSSHWDSGLWDVDGMRHQTSMPGVRRPVDMSKVQAGDTLANHVYFEPDAHISPEMLNYLKELFTDIPEMLTGISNLLFGGSNDEGSSGKALQVKQAAAMGRIGLSFRMMKLLYAGMMEQAVRCASRNRDKDIVTTVPDEQGRLEKVTVSVGDLNGNIRCFPNADENYPESWISKRNTYLQLLADGNADPAMKAILSSPQNQRLGKNLIGLPDFVIPDAASWEKQMAEINLLLEEPANIEEAPPQQVPNPLVPEQMETIQTPPQPVSSIPIDPVYDNNAAEFITVQIFINSAKGQQLKRSKDPKDVAGFENVRLHGIEHQKALMAQQAAMAPPPAPPPDQHHTPAPKGEAPQAAPQSPSAPLAA